MTRSMTRWALAGSMALAALGAVAVLDVGSMTAEAAPSVSPFAGSWSGTWVTVTGGEYVGTYDWVISDQGRITGTLTNTTLSRGGTCVGHVGADGEFMLIDYAPNDAPGSDLNGVNGYPFKGTAVIDGDTLVIPFTSVTATWPGGLFVATLQRN